MVFIIIFNKFGFFGPLKFFEDPNLLVSEVCFSPQQKCYGTFRPNG